MNAYQAQQPTVLIIGSGRLAKHLIHWCALLNKPNSNKPNSPLTWNRSQTAAELFDLAQQADVIWLAVSDSAIALMHEMLKPVLKQQTVVHFSGALHYPDMIAAHPLMTFAHELYDLATYEKIHFALTGANALEEALPFFKNSFFQLAAKDKELYHALCVVTGNLPQILWAQAQPLLTELNIPQQAMQLYLEQSLRNFFQLGPNAVTGPLIRGDQTTINKNLAALEKTNSNLQHIYESFL